jgi:flagellin-like hook-associated protein FlgL
MANGLNALITVNSQMADLQAQATSGKKVNNASDGLAAYLSAKGYSQRADRLQNVNDTLSNNLQTVKAAQTGLDSIRKTITDTLDTLKAASQTQAQVAASGTSYTESDGGGTNIAMGTLGAATTGASNLIGTNFGGSVLTQGLTFSVQVGSGTTATTKYIRISTAAEKVAAAGDGTSATSAAKVVTLDDLLNQLAGAGLTISNRGAVGANYAKNFQFQLQSAANTPVSFQNVTQTGDQATAGAVNLGPIFGSQRAAPANPNGTYTYDKKTGVSGSSSTYDEKFTLTGTLATPPTGGQAADARRAAAAKSYKLAIDQINQYLKSASVSGTNLLNGDSLKVTFDEKGTSTTFQIQDSNNNAMSFGASGLGLVNSTGVSPDINNNFATNDDPGVGGAGSTTGLNNAISLLTNALTTLSLGDAQVSQFQSTVQNRSDFNKSIVGLLNDASNALTAADMTQVSAQYAALQVQQSFAQTIMANTKQADQSVLQLLR